MVQTPTRAFMRRAPKPPPWTPTTSTISSMSRNLPIYFPPQAETGMFGASGSMLPGGVKLEPGTCAYSPLAVSENDQAQAPTINTPVVPSTA